MSFFVITLEDTDQIFSHTHLAETIPRYCLAITVTILHEVHIKTCNLIKKVLLIIGERRNLGTVACVGKY